MQTTLNMATDVVECSTDIPQLDEVSAEVTVATDFEIIRSSLEVVNGTVEDSPGDAGAVVLGEHDLERSFHDGAELELEQQNNSLLQVPAAFTTTTDLPLSHTPPLPPPPYTTADPHASHTNTNNSNSCTPPSGCDPHNTPAICIAPAPPPPVVALGTGGEEPPKKRTKMIKHGNIDVILEGKNLWDEFYRRGTEMIVNRSGRRMFPGFSVSVSGLKPKAKYTMKLEVVLADNHRFKFLNARWLAVGTAEPQPLSESYIHPDSPNSGAFWMRHGISFRKLKITNNKERPGNNALLHSMHKYSLRLIVEEERKTPPGEDKLPAKTVLKMDFPETTFVAVTAYQNEEVTQLKITNNPFAKAFRENAADMDWETAQMLYGNQNIFSPLSQLDGFGNHPRILPSPLLPPTPLTASAFPPISPLNSLPTHHGATATGPGYLTPQGQFPYSSVASPHYFQWPPTQSSNMASATGAHRLPPPTQQQHQTNPLHEHYNFQPSHQHHHYPSVSHHHTALPLPPHHHHRKLSSSQLDVAPPHSFTYPHHLHPPHPPHPHQLTTSQHTSSSPVTVTLSSNLPDFDSVFAPPYVGSIANNNN